jgi:hypothetical protein
MPDNNDEDIENIIDALKEKNLQLNREIRKVSKENMEEFVVDSAGAVINECVDLVKNLGVYLHAAPESKDLSAYAELINASANAIETLNKILIQDKKITSAKELKKMDHDIKRDMLGGAKELLVLSREDMFKQIKEIEAVVIDEVGQDDAKNYSTSSDILSANLS